MRYFALVVCALSLTGAPLAQTARPKIALVLSGGGARGIAHIGVLRELEKAGVPMDLIVGTSFGAVAGGLYAVGYSSEDLGFLLQAVNFNNLLVDRSDRREQSYDLKIRKDAQLFDLEMENWEIALPGGLQSGQRIRQFLDRLTAAPVYGADNNFDNFSIPFRAVATDIVTGKPHVFRSGSFSTAVLSSIAVPGFFSPIEVDSALLVDGGVADNIPVDVALANGADLVIAVDVSSPLKTRKEEFKSLVNVLEQVIGLVMEEEEERNLQRADLVIRPDLKGIGSFSFERAQDLIRIGEEAARAALPRLRQVLAVRNVRLNPGEPRPRLVDPAQFDPQTFEYRPRDIVIDKIEIEGLKRNSPSYIRRQIDTPVKEQVGLATLDRDVTRLHGTDLFTRVAYLLEEKNSQTLLTYRVQESAPTKLGVSFRYDLDYEFSTWFDLTNHGFAGTHSNVFLRALLGPLKNFELGWESGQMLGKNNVISSRVDFYSQKRRIFESHLNPAVSFVASDIVGDYQDQRYGFSGSWHHLFENSGRFELAYEVERVDIDRGVGGLNQKEFRELAKLKGGVRFDTLDDAEFPSAGWQGGFGVDWYDEGLGGDFSFTRYQGDLDYYFEVGRRNIVGLSGFWGLVRGDAPFYERLYTGGGQFSRFASTRFLGLERDEILSRHAAHLGLSYRYRLKQFRLGLVRDLYLAATYRAGLFNREPDLKSFGRPVHGLGFGIYLDAGLLGPIRLEVGGAGRGDLTTYFSIGHFF